jgi:hypothetical protein
MKTIYLAMLIFLIVSCKNTNDKALVIENEKQEIIDSMNVQIEKQRIIDSMTIVAVNNARQREVLVVNKAATTQGTTATPRKKWSGAAKGAVIGAGVGAVTGAIVSDKKGEGAIIGGLAGAGLGAGTGAIIDGKKEK